MKKKVYVTTSWDDGHVLDMRIAKLLTQYGLKGTFYISPTYSYLNDKHLSSQDIRDISMKHEIGAHTMSHPHLTGVHAGVAEQEINKGKKILESIIGDTVSMFCYPFGEYNERVKKNVRDAGFAGARTTRSYTMNFPQDVHELHTTVHAYPFPLRKLNAEKYYWGKLFQPFARGFLPARNVGVSYIAMRGWLPFVKEVFNRTIENGEVFHLWGHSWEVDRYDMWEDLEKLFSYISNREECSYNTNGEIINKKQI